MATTICLYLATLLYVGQAVSFFCADKPAMALVFVGYAVANIGLIAAVQ